jgi:hypothetical protein
VLHYRVAWFDGIEHTGPEQQVALTPLPGGSLSRNFIYFKMEFVTPAKDGDPENNPHDSGDGQNEFTFSANIPGVLTMPLKVSTDPSTAAQYVTDRVTFEVASIGTANPVYTPVGASNGCLVCTATVTGMPTNNADFGKRVASVKYRGTVNKSTYYEVFFLKFGLNHPTCSTCSGCPNWFYYWKNGNVCGITSSTVYSGASYFGQCNPPSGNTIYLGSYASQTNNGPELYTNDEGGSIYVTGNGKGIQCVAATIVHEVNHIDLYSLLGSNTDTDGDGIADTNESYLQLINTKVNDPDTYNMGGRYATYGDNEIRCRNKELGPVSCNPNADWANPGCQHTNQFGPTPVYYPFPF